MVGRHPWWAAPGGAVVAGVLALGLALSMGLSHGFSDPDESAHYVNALFLADWLRSGMPGPLSFARDYYLHFPKLSIGHWPPGWYAALSPVFVAARPSPFEAHCLSAFVAGLPAGLILWGGRRAAAGASALVAAGVYLLLPLVVDGERHFLLDQPAALAVGLAAITWSRAAAAPGWRTMLLFAATAAACPLIKGNGALIALVPAFHIALGQRWMLLRLPSLWVAGVAALVITAPWYAISFKLAAAGFNYAPGLDYAWLALASNARALLANLGVSGLALAAAGGVVAWRGRVDRAERWDVAALAVSVVLATLVFQSLVPAALEPRYLSPTLPWLVVLAVIAVDAAWHQPGTTVRVAAIVCAAVPTIVAVRTLSSTPPDPDLGISAVAEVMRRHPGIWLVDGRSGDEGAVIAAAARLGDDRSDIWVARASQWLSRSDFMGRGYALIVRTPAEAGAVLDRLGVEGVISVERAGRPAYPHSAVLRAALGNGGYALADTPFRSGSGRTLVAVRRSPVAPHVDVLRATVLAGAASAF